MAVSSSHSISSQESSARTIRDFLDVRPHPTVVRLEHLRSGNADWITTAYHITSEVGNHLRSLKDILLSPTGCGMFLIGQYGSGKSHFLAYVTQNLERGTFVPNGPAVTALSLVNYRAETPLEKIVADHLGFALGDEDRRAKWSGMMARYPRGLLLVLDELSEFLRSKADPPSFNEDIRFLQYLGEWCQDKRFWVLAAMQEQIEHVGELEHGFYRKIKDRYPKRFLLSPAHVRDLVRDSILLKKEGYNVAVEQLAGELREAFPDSPLDYQDFCGIYPLHPATLDLLEEVRDGFSQTRGVVDFVVSRLVGNPGQGIAPFLDRPWGSLITPDLIVEHFKDLFEMQPEFLPLAQQLLPYYRKHLAELFPAAAQRELASRALDLLVLVYLSPSRVGLTVQDAAYWLLFKATRIDPPRNLKIIAGILDKFVECGRYVVVRDGRYQLDLDDDSAAALEAQIEREKADLRRLGDMVFELLVPVLEGGEFNPFSLPREEWQTRLVRWHLHDRPCAVFFGNGVPPERGGAAVCIRLPWGDVQPAPGLFILRPARLSPGEDVLELAALLRLAERPWSREAARRIQSRIKERLDLFRAQIKNAYLDAAAAGPNGAPEVPPRVDAAAPLAAWLDAHAAWMFRKIYPAFERFAPHDGPLPKESYVRFMDFVSAHDLGTYDPDRFIVAVRDGYLVPMGLLKKRGADYTVPAKLEEHELVQQVLSLVEQEPPPRTIADHFANPIYGLVPDQVSVLLLFLLAVGALDVVKGGKSLRELYRTLPNPLSYDRVVPGRALGSEHLRHLQALCERFDIRPPKQWTVFEQRHAVKKLRECGRRQTEQFRRLLAKVETPLIETSEAQANLAVKLRQVVLWWAALNEGDDELQAFAGFVSKIGPFHRFVALQSELAEMPQRVDRLLDELARYRHLLGPHLVERCRDTRLAVRVESLGQPPGIDEPDALDRWLHEAESLYEAYKQDYAKRHTAWWESKMSDPVWRWQPPNVARSRHLRLGKELEALRACGERAERLRCRGLVNLDYQPVCACGFDGETSPIVDELRQFDELRAAIERTIQLFFADEAVKAQVQSWADAGFEKSDATRAYLEGRKPAPEVKNVELFDRHMAGVELVKVVDTMTVWELLGERIWDRDSLVAAFASLMSRIGATRLRFSEPPQEVAAPSGVAAWCAQQSLRFGVPLPRGFGAMDRAAMVQALRPEWVAPQTLEQLEVLGLPDEGLDQIVTWLVEGRVQTNSLASSSPLVTAAIEVVRPTSPASCEQLAQLAATLYRHHQRLLHIAGERWLERLDALAESAPPAPVPDMVEVLAEYRELQWVVIDCLGLPLLPAVRKNIGDLFPDWHLAQLRFALVSRTTTTDSWYRQVIDAGFNRRLEKINVVDSLLHERFLPLDDICRLGLAELHVACRRVRQNLDPGLPVLVFADHGFRIRADGKAYTHGGSSTLERIVPVLLLTPD